MAKKIQAAEIIIKTTDGGSYKVMGKEAEKLTKKMNALGGASQSTDRRIKGVTQQSSNATKNFSKQAQTMQGGIVGVYATIAAQVFAVSAAFQFMKSSMETRNLIEGQKAFGMVTGTAYKSLTGNIQDATNGMLGFKAAASSAAIGVAAGLSATQLEGLGKAATDASLALGRDLEDSFNRLIRGVTKAEPELLDELGIILRLENATNKYALTVGKTREQLNAYERTQAVLNDVLGQAEAKYGAIQEKMDPDAFAMGQFSKEMDDLLLGFQNFVIKGIIPLLNFFKDNSMALVSAVLLFVTPILKSVLPNLSAGFDSSKKAMHSFKDEFKKSGSEMKGAFQGVGDALTATPVDAGESKKGLKGLGVKKFGTTGKEKTLNKRQVAAYRRMMREKKGIYMKFNAQEKRAFRNHLNIQEALLKKTTMKSVSIVRAAEGMKQVAYKGTAMVYNATLMGMKAATAGAAWAMNKAMMAAGIIGIIVMLIQGIASLIGWWRDLDETAKASREETKKLGEDLGTLNKELKAMVELRTEDYMLSLKMNVEQAGQAFQSVGIDKQIRAYNKELEKGKKPTDDVIKGFIALAKNLKSFDEGYSGLLEQMEQGLPINEKMSTGYLNMANAIINASEASKRFSQNQQTVNKMLDKQIRKFTELPYQDLIQAYAASMSDLSIALPQMKKGSAERLASGAMRTGAIGLEQYNVGDKTSLQSRMKSATGGDEKHSGGSQVRDALLGMGDVTQLSQEQMLANTQAGKGGNIKQQFSAKQQSNMMKFYHQEMGLVEELAQIKKQGISDEESIAHMEEVQRIQKAIAGDIKTKRIPGEITISALQQDSIKYAEDILTRKKATSDAAAAGTTFEQQGNLLIAKKAQLQDKVQKSQLDELAAKVAQKAIEEKQKGVLLDRTKTEKERGALQLELNGMTAEQLAVRLKGADLETAELINARSAVDNAGTLVSIEEANRLVKERILQVSIDMLKNAKERSDTQLTINAAVRAEQVMKKQMAMDAKMDPTDAKKKLQRGQTRTANNTAMTNNKTQFTNLGTARGNLTGLGEIGEQMGGTGLDKDMILDPKNEAQKKYNALLAQEIALRHKNNLLLLANDELDNIDEGKYITGYMAKLEQDVNYNREKVYTLNPAEKEFNKIINMYRANSIPITAEIADNIRKTVTETQSLKIETELMDGIQSTLSNGFTSMFQTMVDGTKSFKDGMKDLAKSVLSDLAAMFAKAAALKILMAMFPGMGSMPMMGGLNVPTADPIGRYGGMMSPSGKSFAYGGVAQGPNSGYQATLHGNEAVIPLGNDRSVPVEMHGAGGQNTVNVSISMNGQGQSQSSVTGDGMQGLGRSIGGLVQQHLQQEMRPGGLLNPQGTKGRA